MLDVVEILICHKSILDFDVVAFKFLISDPNQRTAAIVNFEATPIPCSARAIHRVTFVFHQKIILGRWLGLDDLFYALKTFHAFRFSFVTPHDQKHAAGKAPQMIVSLSGQRSGVLHAAGTRLPVGP
jgi:hypothetical protein